MGRTRWWKQQSLPSHGFYLPQKEHHCQPNSSKGDIPITNQEQKARLLWNNFKNRMGVSEFSGISYDIDSLLVSHDLNQIEGTFDDLEFDAVIKSILADHAPGLDGFNGKFIRSCWPINKNDFMRLFRDFLSNSIDLTSINTSYIALIPKNNHPEYGWLQTRLTLQLLSKVHNQTTLHQTTVSDHKTLTS